MLAPFAVGQIAILRAISALGQADLPAIVQRTGKKLGLVQRDVRKLVALGLVTEDPIKLTDVGCEEVNRLAGLNGETPAVAEVVAEANAVRAIETVAALWKHGDLTPNLDQPRKQFDQEQLDQLAASIAIDGQLQDILARPNPARAKDATAPALQIVGGERRWRAMGLIIERGIWFAEHPIKVEVRNLTDAQVDSLSLVENMQRADLSPLEEATAFQTLVTKHGWSTAQIAEKVNKTQRFVQLRLKLLELTDDQKAKLSAGELSVKDAGKILANRPEHVPMTADQVLVSAELFILTHAELGKWTSYWKSVECRHDIASHPIVAEMIEARLIKVEGPSQYTGRFEVSAGHHGMLALEQNAGDLTTAKTEQDRDAALATLRAAAQTVKPEDLAPLLVGPFDLTPEGQALYDEALARQQVRDVEEAARLKANGDRIKRVRDAAERSKALVQDFTRSAWPADGLQEVMEESGSPLPWRYVEDDRPGSAGCILDANGRTVDLGSSGWRGPEAGALLRLVMASINAAADLDPIIERPEPEGDAEGEPGEWEPETEEEFLSIITQQFQGHGAAETLAVELTKQAYARATEDGETYGDGSSEWTRLDAKVIADGWVEDFPDCLVTPPSAEAAA